MLGPSILQGGFSLKRSVTSGPPPLLKLWRGRTIEIPVGVFAGRWPVRAQYVPLATPITPLATHLLALGVVGNKVGVDDTGGKTRERPGREGGIVGRLHSWQAPHLFLARHYCDTISYSVPSRNPVSYTHLRAHETDSYLV